MRFLTPLFFFALALTAQAQFQVGLTLPKANYLALEGITASLTIVNRSGAEVALGGPGRSNWLSFEMTDREGVRLSPLEVAGDDMILIPPGGSISRKITVTDAYSPTEIGNYGLKARVAHMASGQFYSSDRVRFNISDAKPMWEQAFGVPPQFKGAGSARRYAILVFNDVSGSSLYLRLIDDKTNLRLQTMRLGPVSMAHDPQITLDQENHLQVLFLAQPHVYAHCRIAPDGSLKTRAYYLEENGDRPQLTLDAKGLAKVVGGKFFDPSKTPELSPEKAGRKVSEKPPGL